MDHADPASARHRDGQPGLGDGVHRGGDERDRQVNLARERSLSQGLCRQHFGRRRDQQHVIEGEALAAELRLERREGRW